MTLAAENIGQVRLRPPAGTEIVAVGIAAVADDVVVDGFIVEGFRSFGVLFGRVSSPQRNCVLKHLVIDGADDAIRAEVADVAPNLTPIVEGLLLYDVWLRNVRGVGINCGDRRSPGPRFQGCPMSPFSNPTASEPDPPPAFCISTRSASRRTSSQGPSPGTGTLLWPPTVRHGTEGPRMLRPSRISIWVGTRA